MAKLYSLQDGKVKLNFHTGQTEAWDSERRFVFVLAGNRGGKTVYGPWWLHREIHRSWEGGEFPTNDYLAVSASNKLFNNAFLPAMMEVFTEVLKIGYYWAADGIMELKCLDPANKRFMQFYQGPNGRSKGLMWGRIILVSAQSSGTLESMTAKAALLDECGQEGFTIEDWEAVQRRISIPYTDRETGERIPCRVLGTTTPYDLGFLYQNIYTPWLNGDPDIDIIQFPSYINPEYDIAEYERAKRTMPAWRFAMFYDGKFERPAGLIYRDFDESAMTIREPFDIPDHWERVVGVDFGGANTATLWLALNPRDGRWYAYHETLMGHMPTEEHAAIAKATAIGIDTLTAVGGAKSEGQPRDDWWAEGFFIEEPPVHHVESGIARVISLIKQDKLRVFSSCTRLLSELRSYRRKLDHNNEPTEVIINKAKFHVLDALRYASSWIEDSPTGIDVMTFADYLQSEIAYAHP